MQNLLLWAAIATHWLPVVETYTAASTQRFFTTASWRQATSGTKTAASNSATTIFSGPDDTSSANVPKSRNPSPTSFVSSATPSTIGTQLTTALVSDPANESSHLILASTTVSVAEAEDVWLCFELKCWRLFACLGAFVLLVLITAIAACCWCRRRYHSTRRQLQRERAAAFDIRLASSAASPVKSEMLGNRAASSQPATVPSKPQEPEASYVNSSCTQHASISRTRPAQTSVAAGTKFMALRANSGQYGYLKMDIGQIVHVTMFTTPDCWVARDPETGASGYVHPSWLAPYNPAKLSHNQKTPKPKSKDYKTSKQPGTRYVNRPDAQKGSKFRAQYAFTATGQHQMDLEKGDILELLEVETTGWLWCKNVNNGKMGYVPGNYLCLVDAAFDPAEEEAAVREVLEANQRTDAEDLLGIEQMVLYDYTAQSVAELSLRSGETVTVIRTLPSGWACCVSRGREGYFPSAYLQQVYEPLTEAKSGSSIARRTSVKDSLLRRPGPRNKLLVRRQSRPAYRSIGRSTYVQLRPDQKPGSSAPRPPLPGRQPTPM